MTAARAELPIGVAARVRVPATSANLGPAFDAAGLALALYDDVELAVTSTDPGWTFDIEGEGADDLARDDTHLIARTVTATLSRLEVAVPGLSLRCRNRIPHARGLGSSAAAIVAGVLAARTLLPDGVDRLPQPAALDLVSELEGHPDNVVAALLGGFTLAWSEEGVGRLLAGTGPEDSLVVSGERVGALRLRPAATIRPVVLVPVATSSTAAARGRLPEQVPHADAATAAGRGALLTAAMTVAPRVLLAATHDVLHQPYRAALMPDTLALVRSLRAEGLAAVVSGAGPTVLVLAADDDQERAALSSAPSGWTATAVPVGDGATAERIG